MTMKRWLRTRGSAVLTSPLFRELRRNKHAIVRQMKGESAVVHYFHQVDDPCSELAVRALTHLASDYAVRVIPHIVPAPDRGAAPEPERLRQWSSRDAADLAGALTLAPAPWSTPPAPEQINQAQAALAGINAPTEFTKTAADIRKVFNDSDARATESTMPTTGNRISDIRQFKHAEGVRLENWVAK